MKNTENTRTQDKKKNKIARGALWALFAIYCGVLLWMLFISRSYRHGYSFSEYLSIYSNFIPFDTILHYAWISTLGSLEFFWLSVWNIMGNLFMLFPLGVMLPCVFPRLDRLWKIVLVVTGTVVLIELAQLIFRVGVVDIDDLILNLSGAMIGYATLKIPPLCRALRAIDILPPKRVSAKKQNRKDSQGSEEEKLEERQCTLK